MKKSLVSLLVLGFLFIGCDSKSPIDDSVIAKKSLHENKYEFVSQTFNLITTDEKFISFKSTTNGLNFDEFKGKKAVLIDVFATWCPPCIEEIPVLKEVREKYKDNFEIVSVLFEKDKPKQEILDFIKEHKYLIWDIYF